MICPYCHQENDDSAHFCRHCGRQLDDLYDDVTFDDAPKPQKQEYAPQQPAPSADGTNKTIVIVVAIIAAAAVAIAACYFLFIAGRNSGKNVTKRTTKIIERQKDDEDDDNSSTSTASDDDDTYHGSSEYNAAALTSSAGYLMPDSSSEYLSRSDISGLTSRELSLARNEIFARHHRLFNNTILQDYFNGKSWYDGYIEPDDFDDSALNSYERANVELLRNVESSKGWYIEP